MNTEANCIHQSDKGYIRSFIFLRWMLVILGAYLTFFSYVDKSMFSAVVVFIVTFAASNVALMLTPERYFRVARFQTAVVVTDIAFGCATFYLLKVPGTLLYVPFMLIYLMAAIKRDLKAVSFSLIAVSLFYGVFSMLRLNGQYNEAFTINQAAELALGNVEAFLRLSLFFIAAVFYLFLSDHVRKDAYVAQLLRDEKRRAEIMAEISRSLLSSLDSQEVLYLIVTRISEVFVGAECSIIQLEEGQDKAKLLVKSAQPDLKDSTIELQAYPEIQQANASRDLLFVPNALRGGAPRSLVAIPMLAHDSLLGIIHVQLNNTTNTLSEGDDRFFRMMSATAANALRNAQLYEEMEHRAKTDFLTGLFNHRSFQATLSTELARARRHGHQLSVLIADLDHLKAVNDNLGHVIGDSVIREVAETIRVNCRGSDVAARYGGEEYAVILPETSLIDAVQVAERIRERINESIYTGVGHVTASIGVANYPGDALGKEDLVRAADRALYVSKNNGRNRVSYFDPKVSVDKQPA
jgi:diguanylate cyclase (GGDEF)-like protein